MSNGEPNPDRVRAMIHPVHEFKVPWTGLVYGKSGTGKTVFASTLPKPLLVIDIVERGAASIQDVPGVDVIRVAAWEDLEDLYWLLDSGDHPYKSVALDQLTQMADLASIKVREDTGRDEEAPLTKRDWGNISSLMRTWTMSFRNLADKGLNLIFLAHERISDMDTGEDQIDPAIGPRLSPATASLVTGAVNFIGNTFIREDYEEGEAKPQYCMRVGPNSSYTTKLRVTGRRVIPPYIVNPTFDAILALTTVKAPTVKKRKTNG